jgi:nucleoside-diphosphate-sugar epimerase
MSTVLVTGGSGYVGTHVIAALLREGREVRTTVRSLARAAELRAAVRRGDVDDGGLELVTADLSSDEGWDAAARGCEEVHHVASPIPVAQPTDPQELVAPAREGTLRVLRAARDAGARRVVITGSFAAIGYTPKDPPEYDESDWTDPSTPGLGPYPLSKTVAERSAWDFVADTDLELVVLNPTGIFGPPLTTEIRSTIYLIKAIADGTLDVLPRARFGIADVRDVAALHVRAMAVPQAAGKRYLCLADGPAWSYVEVAKAVGGALGIPVPTQEAPGEDRPRPVIHNDRAKAELGFAPRPAAATITDTAIALRDLGLLA